MLPDDVAKDVRDMKYVLITVDNVVAYLMSELSRYNDRHLRNFFWIVVTLSAE